MEPSLLPNIYEFISHTYPFTQLTTLEQDALAARVKISYHAKDSTLDNELLCSVGVYMIRTGALEEISRDGSLRARLTVGDSFGYSQLDKSGESDYKVVFIENTLLYLIDKQVLNFLLERNPKLKQFFNSHDAERLKGSRSLMEAQGEGSIFLKPVGDMCRREIAAVAPTDSVQTAAQRMLEKQSDLAIVEDKGTLQGVITKSDLSARVLAQGLSAQTAVQSVMSRDIVSIEASRAVYEALELMLGHNIKNLPVLEGSTLIGSVDPKMLLQNTILQPVYVIKAIARQNTLEGLKELAKKREEIFLTLERFNLPAHLILEVLSQLADALGRRLCELALEKLGPAPCGFAFFAAGSQARSEVQLTSDQDNALVFERALNQGEREYFANLAEFVCQGLDHCGFRLCEGGYMAMNPRFALSVGEWEELFASWVRNIDSKSLLDMSVFLDLRAIYGDSFLVKRLQDFLVREAGGSKRFLALLCASCLAVTPPLGTFRQFVLTKDGENRPSFNIKSQVINLVTEIARIYGLSSGCASPLTAERLQAASRQGLISAEDLRELSEAVRFILRLRLDLQKKAVEQGKLPTNNIEPQLLSQFERNHLRDALRIIRRQQEAAAFRFKGRL